MVEKMAGGPRGGHDNGDRQENSEAFDSKHWISPWPILGRKSFSFYFGVLTVLGSYIMALSSFLRYGHHSHVLYVFNVVYSSVVAKGSKVFNHSCIFCKSCHRVPT